VGVEGVLAVDLAQLHSERDRLPGDPEADAEHRRESVRLPGVGPQVQPDGQVSSNAHHHARLSAAELHIQHDLFDAQHHDR